ncbi:hypothetical protein MMC27_005163 [Xylographa pallens]|nr:hypothetical protein [Xylographa pallens]
MESEDHLDENSPLIAKHPSPPAAGNFNNHNRVLLTAYIVLICIMFGDYMQQSPKIQIYESILCSDYYSKIDTHLMQGRDCKVKAVQKELATLRGVERLTELLPTVLAIPYGIAAKKYGHRTILTLGCLGFGFAQTWTLFVCWFPETFPIRLVWAQWAWQLIGGGSTVISTMFFLVLADMTPAESRTIVFFRIHAALMVAGILGPTTASFLMGYNVWLPWVLGVVLIFIAVPLTLLLPNRKDEPDLQDNLNDDREIMIREDSNTAAVHKGIAMKERVFAALQNLKITRSLLAANVQVLLLLIMAGLSNLGNESFALLLLIYVPERYHWTFAKAGYLWSLSAGVQLVLLSILLPFLSHLLLKHLHISSHDKDRALMLFSCAVMTTGALCLGLAPEIGPAIIGIILMSFGAGLLSLVRSLITLHVLSDNISVVYSVMSMVNTITAALAGPLFNETYSAGLQLGNMWSGLPFLIAAGLVALDFVLALFIRENYATSMIGQSENHDD